MLVMKKLYQFQLFQLIITCHYQLSLFLMRDRRSRCSNVTRSMFFTDEFEDAANQVADNRIRHSGARYLGKIYVLYRENLYEKCILLVITEKLYICFKSVTSFLCSLVFKSNLKCSMARQDKFFFVFRVTFKQCVYVIFS